MIDVPIMRKSPLLSILLWLLLLEGCENRPEYVIPEFRKEIRADVHIINTLDDFAKKVAECGEYLLVLERDPFSLTHFHVYDKKNGQKFGDYINEGRGPCEGILFSLLCVDGAEVVLVETILKKTLSFSIDSLLQNGLSSVSERPYTAPPFSMWNYIIEGLQVSLGHQTYLEHDTANDIRIMVNKDGTVSTYNDYPVHSAADRWEVYRHRPLLTVSPDKKRLAVASSIGAILETFDIKSGITNIATRKYIKPDYHRQDNIYKGYNDNTICCFTDITSSNGYIYTTWQDVPDKNCLFRAPDRIAVFDWKGNPVALIRIDNFGIVRFCVNEGQKTIYANLKDREGNYYLAQITW